MHLFKIKQPTLAGRKHCGRGNEGVGGRTERQGRGGRERGRDSGGGGAEIFTLCFPRLSIRALWRRETIRHSASK